ncbi:hypothetical protein Q2T41_16500 [Maribacter confluentis]|uniref:Uncharacterized protein n=1 Tax=Maribacter confluentis TaxID=1656093 RepID=A0ABT8RTJ6_9FLAO|nr:hypothetical protein [Maribacter confluentis]MDO1514256.1 hypothetical protein [Maribacter confluentis]
MSKKLWRILEFQAEQEKQPVTDLKTTFINNHRDVKSLNNIINAYNE